MPKNPICQQDYWCKCNRQEPGPDTTGGVSCHWCLGIIETADQVNCPHDGVTAEGVCAWCHKVVRPEYASD